MKNKLIIFENQIKEFESIKGQLNEEFQVIPQDSDFIIFINCVKILLSGYSEDDTKIAHKKLLEIIGKKDDNFEMFFIIDHKLVGNVLAKTGIDLAIKLRDWDYHQFIIFLSKTPEDNFEVTSMLNTHGNTLMPYYWVEKGHGSIGIYNPEYIKSKIQKLIHNREQYFLPTFYRLEDLRKLKDLIVDAFIEILKELEYTYNSIIKLGEKYKENNEVGFSSRENYRTKKFKTIIDKRNNFDFRYQESQGQAYSEKYTLNSGEIDLLVKFKRNDVMIIEALNLNSLKIEYLSNHYSKLIKGYNPLGLPNLCMMVYFEGRDFKNFKEGYISYLKSVKTFGEGINLINISVKGTEELNYDEIINPSNLGDYHHVAVIEHIITYNKFDYKILHLIGNFNWNESI